MKVKILMVCLGNICRSPLAQGILESKLDPLLFEVDSCGTSNYHIGGKPDHRSIEIARMYDIDITRQRASQFTTHHFDSYDYIYAMDSSNYNNIGKLARNQKDLEKVSLIMDELYPNSGTEVPDPYYGGEQGFEDVYQMLDKACNRIASKLKNTKSN